MPTVYIPVNHSDKNWNHWVAFYEYCTSLGVIMSRASWRTEMNTVAEVLRKFNGALVYNENRHPGIIGMLFATSEDLLFFKLTFN